MILLAPRRIFTNKKLFLIYLTFAIDNKTRIINHPITPQILLNKNS